MPGMILGGRYQVQDKIGTGGMATVFRGLDEVLGRTVAIKTMLPQYASDPSFAARFKQEAQAAAALQSPYIVSVYDWGKDADTYYIVMEYLRGTDLKSGIRKHGALDCKKVAQIGSQIAQALSVAHKHDIIHRDIKPQNIMVQPDGNIKVMDFGIARAKNSHLTQDNSVLGTAHYVSPEQTQGKALGPTTDIYSLGIVMYEAATGQVPFQGDDAISVALKQVNEQPKPPSQLNPAVDPALEAIILKCMQKSPADRFQTADELHRTLRDYLAGRVQAVNSATALLPTNKIESGTGVQPVKGGTASMPRVERTNRYRPQSATEQAAEMEAERERKHRRNIILGAIGAIALIAAIAFAALSAFGSSAAEKAVPQLVGMMQEEAIATIREEGFEVGDVNPVASDKPEGEVIDQSPSSTSMRPEGTKINLTVSKGASTTTEVEVPDLKNYSPEDAENLLLERQLVPQKGEDQASDEVEAGKVCAQDTKAGEKVAAGTTITYHVSTGADAVAVPDVLGDDQNTARDRLSNGDGQFVVTVEHEYSSSYSEGRVCRIEPAAGTMLEKGAEVTIYVSDGPQPVQQVVVYDVTNWSYADAKATLELYGFKVTLGSGPADGTVTSQSVKGSAPYGSEIVLTTVPNYSGGSDSGNGGGTGSGNGGGSENGSGGQTGTEGTGETTGGNGSGDGSSQIGTGATTDGSGSHTN